MRWRRRRLLLVALLFLLSFVCFTHSLVDVALGVLATGRFLLTSQRGTGFLLDEVDLDCGPLLANTGNYEELEAFQFDTRPVERRLMEATDFCKTLHETFEFPAEPRSQEEADFPLAYGIVIHDNLVQFLLMLSSIYQPQNEYAVAVDGGSSEDFRRLALILPNCFDNVHIFTVGKVRWCGVEVMDAVVATLRYLTARPRPWRYFQYLSGVDAPLKTNLEMVRIFKALNGSANVEVSRMEAERLLGHQPSESPLPLFKASLSATFSRETANFLMSNSIVQEQLAFLRKTHCPDESMWLTFLGNSRVLRAPGSFNASRWLERRSELHLRPSLTSPDSTYYIARYQLWNRRECRGEMKSYSCVFGVGNVPALLASPHLIAHKFYMNVQPAGYFCVLKEIQRRTRNPVKGFATSLYSELPFVKLQRGISLDAITSRL